MFVIPVKRARSGACLSVLAQPLAHNCCQIRAAGQDFNPFAQPFPETWQRFASARPAHPPAHIRDALKRVARVRAPLQADRPVRCPSRQLKRANKPTALRSVSTLRSSRQRKEFHESRQKPIGMQTPPAADASHARCIRWTEFSQPNAQLSRIYDLANEKSSISIGRGRGTRTHDPRFWRPMLYQLSYTPMPCGGC